MRRFCLVLLSYSIKAASKIAGKLEEEIESWSIDGVREAWDMAIVGKNRVARILGR